MTATQSLVLFGYVAANTRIGGVASPYSWVGGPLAPGSLTHLINCTTGTAMPYTVPAGYTATLILKTWTVSTNVAAWLYLDTYLLTCMAMGQPGDFAYENKLIPSSTAWTDPTAATAHIIDAVIENLDPYNECTGAFDGTVILETIGTEPLPDTKDVYCKFCGATMRDVPSDATVLACTNCGKTIVLMDVIRGTRRMP